MKTEHTPGPWKVSLGRGANPRLNIQASGGFQIASTPILSRDPRAKEENALRLADADLIAAAPELLALVRWSCAWANGWEPSKAQKEAHYLCCLSVIAKATEGTPSQSRHNPDKPVAKATQ